MKVRPWQMEIASRTDDFFRHRQAMATDHTKTWGNQIEQSTPKGNHGDLRIYD
jgi:hypothetical protein